MPIPTTNYNNLRPYRDAQTIADIAITEAQHREENYERAGQLYMMGEILTALHRQAEALEACRDWMDELHVLANEHIHPKP